MSRIAHPAASRIRPGHGFRPTWTVHRSARADVGRFGIGAKGARQRTRRILPPADPPPGSDPVATRGETIPSLPLVRRPSRDQREVVFDGQAGEVSGVGGVDERAYRPDDVR